MVSYPRSISVPVELLINSSDHAPENLVAFLDGRPLPFSEPSGPEPERPKKRRKITGPHTSNTPLHSSDANDFLTLARVDISMVKSQQSRGAAQANIGPGI